MCSLFLPKGNVMSATFLQYGLDCFLLACEVGHQEIVCELLTKDKVEQNVVTKVRNYTVLCLFVHCVIVCVPHLQYGRGAVHLACGGGHVQLVETLVGEFGLSPDTRDNVSILTVHELKLQTGDMYPVPVLYYYILCGFGERVWTHAHLLMEFPNF